jgi:hypothetical protein
MTMGLEMIGLLVHKPTLSSLLEQSWSDLKEGMGGGAFGISGLSKTLS